MRTRDRVFIAILFGAGVGAGFGTWAVFSPGAALFGFFTLAVMGSVYIALVFIASAGRAFE